MRVRVWGGCARATQIASASDGSSSRTVADRVRGMSLASCVSGASRRVSLVGGGGARGGYDVGSEGEFGIGVGLGTDWARVGLRLGSSWVQVGLELCVGWARVGCTSAMVECKGRVQGSGGASRLRGLAVVSDGVWEQSGMRDEVRCGVRNDRSRGVWGGCVNGSVGRRSGADVGRRSGARAASVKRTFKEVCGRESRKALASAPGA